MAKYLIIAMIVMSSGFAVYFKYSQEKMRVMAADNAKLSTAVEAKDAVIKQERETAAENYERINQLQSKLSETEEKVNNLRGVLRKHDLTRLAGQKPGLIEKRIENATNKLFSDFFGSSTDSVQ